MRGNNSPRPGMRVTDVAHRPVGFIVAVKDGCFRVRLDGDGGRLVWVGDEAVFWVQAGVQLVCNREDLARYLVEVD